MYVYIFLCNLYKQVTNLLKYIICVRDAYFLGQKKAKEINKQNSPAYKLAHGPAMFKPPLIVYILYL